MLTWQRCNWLYVFYLKDKMGYRFNRKLYKMIFLCKKSKGHISLWDYETHASLTIILAVNVACVTVIFHFDRSITTEALLTLSEAAYFLYSNRIRVCQIIGYTWIHGVLTATGWHVLLVIWHLLSTVKEILYHILKFRFRTLWICIGEFWPT